MARARPTRFFMPPERSPGASPRCRQAHERERPVHPLGDLGLRHRVAEVLTYVEEVQQLAEKAIGFLGQIDCLVNNAGITFNRPFGRVTVEQYNRLYNVNVRAQFFLTQRIAEDMVKHGGGAMCNVTSIHGVSGARALGLRGLERRDHRLHPHAVRRIGPQGDSRERDRARLRSRRELLEGHRRLRSGSHGGMGEERDSRRARGERRSKSANWPCSFAPTTRNSSSARPSWPTAARRR